ncbi:hypothetical protein SUDANB15_06517 [Streptomyces sp. enrichment culture]|uniref:DUF6281 family protein n=1 Tax=Streptomyces sp. enrichment culture TaxID=1795815 RepID=UPI003F580188
MRVTRSLPRDDDRSPRLRFPPLSSVMVVAAAVLTAACAAQGADGEAEGSCALTATYGGRTYTGVAGVDSTAGDALGTAEFPPCDDTPGHPDDAGGHEPATVHAVDGVDPRAAIAVRYTSDEFVLLAVRPDGDLPPKAENLAGRSAVSPGSAG